MRYLLIFAAFLMSCGIQGNKKSANSKNDLPSVLNPVEFNYVDTTRNLQEGTDDKEKYSDSINKGLAEAEAWGVSNKSGYSPDLPNINVEDAFTIKKDDPYHDKLASMLSDVLSRMKDRCPVFAEKRPWKPIVLIFEKTTDESRWGGQVQVNMSGWSGSDGKFVSTFGPYFGDREERIVLWQETLKSFKDDKGVDPWNYENDSVSPAMLAFESSKYQADVTLSHEIGHWFVRSLLNESGRIDIQTTYFSEDLANWISAVCYVHNFEKADFVRSETDKKDHEEPMKLWPVANVLDDLPCFNPDEKWLSKNPSQTYSLATSSDSGLGALIASLVYLDKFDSKALMKSTVDTILEMAGKKVICRDNDSSCYGIYSYVNTKLISTDIQRPLVYTLGEFIRLLDRKISVPEKAVPMWNRHKEVILGIEK